MLRYTLVIIIRMGPQEIGDSDSKEIIMTISGAMFRLFSQEYNAMV